jgi:hypothetical protein
MDFLQNWSLASVIALQVSAQSAQQTTTTNKNGNNQLVGNDPLSVSLETWNQAADKMLSMIHDSVDG